MVLRIILAGLLLTGLSFAQGGGRGSKGGGDTGGGGSGMGQGAAKETKAQQIGTRLKLSKEQATEVEAIFNSIIQENGPVIQAVQKSRTDVATAMVNGKKGADLEPLLTAMNNAQFQLTGLEVQAYKKIVELLKPNQVAKAPEAFDLMADLFIPQRPMGGGMGGRGGGNRGGGGDRGGR